MDTAIEKVLREFEERADKESERMRDMDPGTMQRHVDEFLLSVGPATGQLINLLVKETEAKTIVEVGSSYGYSTVWLAEAARETGGRVISLELHEDKQRHARSKVEEAGLGGVVDFKLGDALDSLRKLEVSMDFVLLDLWKQFYIPCFELFYPRLSPGALIAADNMIYPEFSRKDAAAYQQLVRSKPDMQSMLLTVGSGIELSRCTRGVDIV